MHVCVLWQLIGQNVAYAYASGFVFWSMKLRVQDQGEDQRRPGKRLYVRTVKHVS